MDVDAALASLQGGGGGYREVVRPVLLQQFGMSYSSLPLSSRGVDLLVCRGFGWHRPRLFRSLEWILSAATSPRELTLEIPNTAGSRPSCEDRKCFGFF